jgi:hypothetical protein
VVDLAPRPDHAVAKALFQQPPGEPDRYYIVISLQRSPHKPLSPGKKTGEVVSDYLKFGFGSAVSARLAR